MGIVIAVYLVVAGVLGAGVKEGFIKDDSLLKNYQFELKAAQTTGDLERARYIQSRIDRMGLEKQAR